MMQKLIGATMLVAGTCIGSGMIALPMLLSKLGLLLSIILMLLIWLLMYFSALILVELSLQAGQGLSLGDLGEKYSGKVAELMGVGSFKILSYALVAVYLYAGTSVIQKLLLSTLGLEYSFNVLTIIYSSCVFLLFLLPLKSIDYINRFLFLGLLTVVAVLIIGLFSTINWHNLPLISTQSAEISSWKVIIPVVFTSFGFQGSCHSFVNYCDRDPVILKKALFWGSLIPAIVYIIWTFGTLSVVYNDNQQFYEQMLDNKVDVGGLVQELSSIASGHNVQMLTWWISILAIITSILGVGIGLIDTIKTMLPGKMNNSFSANILASLIMIVPAALIAIIVPNAFIAVLGFAGMILVLIAILLPAYLFYKAKFTKLNYSILKHKALINIVIAIGVAIICCEVSNILHKI